VVKIIEKPLKVGSEPGAEMYFQCLERNDPKLKTPLSAEEVGQ
jgi:hypothetical protein